MHRLRSCSEYGLAAALAALASFSAAQAGVTILHTFTGGTDGAHPYAGLVEDPAGNFYGTTYDGGGTGCRGLGCGTVFKVASDGTETVLHSFIESDGAHPRGALIEDSEGNLFGTTEWGGSTSCNGHGCGTVFELAPDGTEKVLFAFQNGHSGKYPAAGLIEDKAGTLYGTTAFGGRGKQGIVFKLARDGTEKVLQAFGGNVGAIPDAGLIKDKAGNLYSTTPSGGDDNFGTVFRLAPDGTETVLYAFKGWVADDGGGPNGGVIRDSAGSLYGTTTEGLGDECDGAPYGCGAVFKIAADGTETVLYSFMGGSDGSQPYAGLIKDNAGNFYGTTLTGGGSTACDMNDGCGTVFKLAPDGTETVLYAFTGGSDGAIPYAGLIKDKGGNLYGTAAYGGSAGCYCGTLFKVKK